MVLFIDLSAHSGNDFVFFIQSPVGARFPRPTSALPNIGWAWDGCGEGRGNGYENGRGNGYGDGAGTLTRKGAGTAPLHEVGQFSIKRLLQQRLFQFVEADDFLLVYGFELFGLGG